MTRQDFNGRAILLGFLVSHGGNFVFGILIAIVTFGFFMATGLASNESLEEVKRVSGSLFFTSFAYVYSLAMCTAGGYVSGRIAKKSFLFYSIALWAIGWIFGIALELVNHMPSQELSAGVRVLWFALALPATIAGGWVAKKKIANLQKI